MNITFKRNYKLLIAFVGIILLSFVFSNTRMISYNFGKYITEYVSQTNEVTNSTDIFDDSSVHDISIDITDEQYEYILSYYKNNSEKEYVEVNVRIDGTTIENVGLRLKGDLDLVEILSNDTSSFIQSSFLIKFDKYIEGQTYNGLSEIALRVDTTDSILGQLMSFKIFKSLGLFAPSAGYTTLTFGDYGTYVYMINEVIDEDFIEENFTGTSGVLYKALNSLSFSFLGDDPTLYVDLFEQETSENNYDLKLLINILDFVSNSTDEEFEENIEHYIDIDSYIGMIALDEVLGKQDMLLGLLNNYYIFIDSETNKAYFITWDQKMSFGNVNTALYDILLKYYTKNELENLDDVTSLLKFTQTGVKVENVEDDGGDKTYLNDLRKRLLENEKYKALYEEKIAEYQELIYSDGLAEETLDYYVNTFTNFSNYTNFITSTYFNTIVENIKNYISNNS